MFKYDISQSGGRAGSWNTDFRWQVVGVQKGPKHADVILEQLLIHWSHDWMAPKGKSKNRKGWGVREVRGRVGNRRYRRWKEGGWGSSRRKRGKGRPHLLHSSHWQYLCCCCTGIPPRPGKHTYQIICFYNPVILGGLSQYSQIILIFLSNSQRFVLFMESWVTICWRYLKKKKM